MKNFVLFPFITMIKRYSLEKIELHALSNPVLLRYSVSGLSGALDAPSLFNKKSSDMSCAECLKCWP